LPPGTSAQIDAEGKINVISKPSADALKSARGAKEIKAILGDVAKGYMELGKPVGPLSYRQIAPITNLLGTENAKKYAVLKADIQKTTSFLGKAISGAAVSEQEAERLKRMIPQLGDTEVTFEGKMEALNKYMNQTIALAEDQNASFEDAMNIMDRSGATEAITFDLAQDIKFKRVGDTIDLTGAN
jgi:predicted nucleic acid-binding protein